jgi:hypothetical protein
MKSTKIVSFITLAVLLCAIAEQLALASTPAEKAAEEAAVNAKNQQRALEVDSTYKEEMAKKEGVMKNLSAQEAAIKRLEEPKQTETSAEWAANHPNRNQTETSAEWAANHHHQVQTGTTAGSAANHPHQVQTGTTAGSTANPPDQVQTETSAGSVAVHHHKNKTSN